MKIAHVLSFILLAIWLIITGLAGLAGITLSPVLAEVMNILALVAGILFLVNVGKYHCSCEKCKDTEVR